MKGNPDAPRCGFSQKTVNLLREQDVDFGWFDILEDEAVRQGTLCHAIDRLPLQPADGSLLTELKKINDWPTFPQIIVNGELIGGLDIVKEM